MTHQRGKRGVFGVALGLFVMVPVAAGAGDLARQAQATLAQHCGRCHGPDSPAKGGMDYVLDPARLIARGKLVPGFPERSKLYQRVREGSMPPRKFKDRLTIQEVALLRRWIERGGPTAEAVTPATFVSEGAVLRLIGADLARVEPRHRRFIRYFSLVSLANAGASERRLKVTRQAIAKLLNSLSWHPRITVPHPIDPAGTLLRVDLRDYQWTASLWNRLQDVYPYGALQGAGYASVRAATHCEVPVIRADWFVATASRPPLYYDLLEMPDTDRALERLLRVDVRRDLDEDSVARAGFNGSGVSRNNRLIERHDAAFGAYWHSYDFSDNTSRQNLFEHPLGPQTGHDGFEQAGGEIIFNLPNGLQGYALVDGVGRRIDRASVEIVSDPNRPDHIVEAGLSCMSCHTRGMIRKDDQVRAHVTKNPTVFSAEDAAVVRAQYVKHAVMDALFERDAQRLPQGPKKDGYAG